MTFRIPPHIQTLSPYMAGKPIEELAREKGLSRIVKLASNENPLGASPLAIEAAVRSLSESSRYVDPAAFELRSAASAYFQVPLERIIAGAGTDALLSYIVKALTGEQEEVLTAESTFIGIFVNTRKHNRVLTRVPMRNYGFDLDAIRARISPATRLIYIANANNPTSTMLTRDALIPFLDSIPPDIYVILDEAYFHYSAHLPGYPDGLQLQYDNLIVTRTLSKDFGLAGLRIGFAFAHPDIISNLYKVKLPFEPSITASKAAIAAFGDRDFVSRTVDLNSRMLRKMVDHCDKLEIPHAEASANFVLLLLPDEAAALHLYAQCLDRGLIIRPVKSFGISNGIRINTGTEEETEFALTVISSIYPEIRDQQRVGAIR